MLWQGESRADLTPYPQQAFKMLERGRTDFFIYGLYSGSFVARKMDIFDKVESLPHFVSQEAVYITFSKKSKYTHLLSRANDIIERLREEGAIDSWIEKYLKEEREPSVTN